MRTAAPNKQGYLDALCGIYALTNFLRDLRVNGSYFCWGEDHRERSDEAFSLLIDVAYRLGMLRPDFMLEGYASHHLVKLWNTLSDEADLPCKAYLISKLKRLGTNLSTFDVVENVLSERYQKAVLLLWDGHWLLSSKLSKKTEIAVADSANKQNARTSLQKSMINSAQVDGFVLLDRSSKIRACTEIELA